MKAIGVIGFWLYTLVGVAWVIASFVAALAGIDHYWGPIAAAAVLVGCYLLRTTIPLLVAAFLGATQVWGWQWAFALLFVAPQLAFAVPALFAITVAAIGSNVARVLKKKL